MKKHTKPASLSIIWYNKSNVINASKLSKYDLVIVSYDLLTAESELPSKPIHQISWVRCILDECHIIRNSATKMSRACYKLTSVNRWAMTGTPIHNSIIDLYSVFKFLNYKPFDDKRKFKELYSGKSKDLVKFNQIIRSILLRRTKNEMKENYNSCLYTDKRFILKEKYIVKKCITLAPIEMEVYSELLTQSHSYLAGLMTRCVASKNKTTQEIIPKQQKCANSVINDVLVFITRLRQFCIHPCLIKSVNILFEFKFEFVN